MNVKPINWLDRLLLKYRFYQSDLSLGDRGELVAERFLIRQGMKIIDRSMMNDFGEIDLIAADKRTIVFVEVKTRKSDLAGNPAEAVDERKQAKITSAALAYLKKHDLLEHESRFDVVSIIWPHSDELPEVEYFANAFDALGSNRMFG